LGVVAFDAGKGVEMAPDAGSYLLAGQPTELERLQLQAKVWEPAGRALLAQLPDGPGRRALDLGCGALGWLRILSEWVGPAGSVVGSDFDDRLLAGAGSFVEAEALRNVTLVKDDLFASRLPARSFDLVHSRFLIAPLGRAEEQIGIYLRLVRPGGRIVVEDPDFSSWRVNPEAPAVQRLIDLIAEGFRAAGGDANAGRELPSLLRRLGVEPVVSAQVAALSPGHPYLRLPLQFAASLRPRLETLIGGDGLGDLLRQAEDELNRPGTWGTTFMLIQAVASAPS
jgi:SAM-dependent methyltransferase